MMSEKTTELRLPAEWEPQDGVMIIWPHEKTDWAYMLDEARECVASIITAINAGKERVALIVPQEGVAPDFDPSLTQTYRCPANDTWARDVCAITTIRNGQPVINDFKFNGWGLKFAADSDNLLTGRLFRMGSFGESATYANHLSFVLEGGSIESDGNGLLLTTTACLLSPNRNGGMTKDEIEAYLKENLAARKILWLDHGYLEGDDTDSHIDTLARLAPDNKIIYVGTDNKADTHYLELKKMEEQLKAFTNTEGDKFALARLPLPDPIFDDEGKRLPATYANFLIGNGFVLVPTYGQPTNDKAALDAIASAFPKHRITGIDCNALIKQHGSLHCVTMQFPQNALQRYGKND